MEGNGKKLAVLVMIAAIGMFSTAARAWDNDNYWKNHIMGDYAFTGAGHCLISTTGFDSNYVPNPCPAGNNPPFGCETFLVTQVWEGDYAFEPGSSGKLTARIRGSESHPGGSFAISIVDAKWEFNYTKTSMFRFKYQLKPGTYDEIHWVAGGAETPPQFLEEDGSCEGVVARDGQNINVTCGPPGVILTAVIPGNPVVKLPIQALCSFSHVGIRVDE